MLFPFSLQQDMVASTLHSLYIVQPMYEIFQMFLIIEVFVDDRYIIYVKYFINFTHKDKNDLSKLKVIL